jgi:hypothetical protein
LEGDGGVGLVLEGWGDKESFEGFLWDFGEEGVSGDVEGGGAGGGQDRFEEPGIEEEEGVGREAILGGDFVDGFRRPKIGSRLKGIKAPPDKRLKDEFMGDSPQAIPVAGRIDADFVFADVGGV